MRERKSRSHRAFGIANHLGGVWSSHTFDTEAQAQAYLDGQRVHFPAGNLSRHKVAPVRVTITILKGRGNG